MLIINPHKRGTKPKTMKAKRKKKASPAQLAARRKFIAMAKARAKAKRGSKVNPKKRKAARKHKAKRVTVTAKRNPVMARKTKRRTKSKAKRRFSFRARRNPIVPKGFGDSHIKPAIVGAAGALINDVAVGAIIKRLPVSMQRPELRHAVKALVAVGLGVAASKARIASSSMVKAATVGALTCVTHDAARAQVQKLLPSIQMGEYLSEVLGPVPYRAVGYGMGEQLDDGEDYDDDSLYDEEEADYADLY